MIDDNFKDYVLPVTNNNIYLKIPIIEEYSNHLKKIIYNNSLFPSKKDFFGTNKKNVKKYKEFDQEDGLIKEDSKEYSESNYSDSCDLNNESTNEVDVNPNNKQNLSINILCELVCIEYVVIEDFYNILNTH